MKIIYFIRYGESEGNVGPIRQMADTPLTEKGISQAKVVADRCLNIPIEIVVCSTMTRTKQTASYILEKINKPIEYSDLFVERRRASETLGNSKDDPSSVNIEKEIAEHFHESGWHFSDEENFYDLKKRALDCLKYLADRPEENILVVTHGVFLRVITACVMFEDKLNSYEGKKFMTSMHMENTGITVFNYDDKREGNPWSLWIWNDHAHLG